MLFYDLSIIRDSQNHHHHQGFGSLYGELPKEKLQKLALQAPVVVMKYSKKDTTQRATTHF